MVIGDPEVDIGIEVRMDHRENVGADRLVNALAAHRAHGGPLIIIDFGTATTFDIVGPDGAYEGGVIAPSAQHSVEALYRAAAQLPRVKRSDEHTSELQSLMRISSAVLCLN